MKRDIPLRIYSGYEYRERNRDKKKAQTKDRE